MLEHPIDTVKSLSGLISDIYNDPALLKRISKEKLSEWEDQLKIFETGNDYQRGKANGELIVDVLATFSGVGLDEKLASEVPKMAKLEKIFSADEIVVRPTKVIEGSGKATTVFRDELSQSKSSQVWGELSDGTNQGIKHFADYWELYPERIPSIAERLGVDPSKFAKTAEGFENFTNEALRITRTEGVQMKEIGGKKIYFMNGAENAKKGIVVIMKDGKLQSMMPSELRSFLKME